MARSSNLFEDHWSLGLICANWWLPVSEKIKREEKGKGSKTSSQIWSATLALQTKILQNQILIKSIVIVIKKFLDEVTFSNKAAKFRGVVLVSF